MFVLILFFIHYMFRPLWAILRRNIQLLNHRKVLCLQGIRCSVCFLATHIIMYILLYILANLPLSVLTVCGWVRANFVVKF
jgi:hypothetical protein